MYVRVPRKYDVYERFTFYIFSQVTSMRLYLKYVSYTIIVSVYIV